MTRTGGSVGRILIAALAAVAAPAAVADVTLDGVVVPKASSMMSIPVEVTEFREIGACPRLLAGYPEPGVCLSAPSPVPPLDAQLAGAAAARFAVGVETAGEPAGGRGRCAANA